MESQIDINQEAELKKIFSAHFNNPSLTELIKRGFVWVNFAKQDIGKPILFVGMNPSFRPGQDNRHHYGYCIQEAVKKYPKHYKNFQNIVTQINGEKCWNYIDLFYCRERDQKKIDGLFALNEPSVIDFFCEQLMLTQSIIEYLKPKVIVVCNRRAGVFFGGKGEIGQAENIWMGYTFSDGRICEDINPRSISSDFIKKTELKGTSVLFERSFRHLSNLKVKELERTIADKIKNVLNPTFS